jgi:hypothetical protein
MDGKVLTKDSLLLDGSFVLDMSATVNCCMTVLTSGRSETLRLLLVEIIKVY